MDGLLAEKVYESLCGLLKEEYRLKEVEDLFAAGSPCDRYYTAMAEACGRLNARLGVDEDPDVEQIIQAWMLMMETVGLRMYHYGVKIGRE